MRGACHVCRGERALRGPPLPSGRNCANSDIEGAALLPSLRVIRMNGSYLDETIAFARSSFMAEAEIALVRLWRYHTGSKSGLASEHLMCELSAAPRLAAALQLLREGAKPAMQGQL